MLNNDNRFDIDLSYGQVFENELLDSLLGKCTIEVKTERDIWASTGNIYIEYKSRGKPSGIAVSKSKYYFIFLSISGDNPTSNVGMMFDTDTLKSYLKSGVKSKSLKSNVKGGDDGTSLGILLPISRIQEVALHGIKEDH